MATSKTTATSKAIRRFLASIGRKGGRTTTKRLTPKRREEIVKTGGRARWKRRSKHIVRPST